MQEPTSSRKLTLVKASDIDTGAAQTMKFHGWAGDDPDQYGPNIIDKTLIKNRIQDEYEKYKAFWEPRGEPIKTFDEYIEDAYWNDASNRPRMEWADHPHTEITGKGRIAFHSYPYQLYGDDLRQLAELADAGMDVLVSTNSAYGHGTLFVQINSPYGKDLLPRHPNMPKKCPTWLYRMWDQSGNLLYIGISNNAFTRFSQHEKAKPWINEVARWERDRFDDRESALKAEREAIKKERPKYNVVHNRSTA